MTKAEFIAALEPFTDDQSVCVLLIDERSAFPRNQLSIQFVDPFPPWNGALPDKSNWLVGITCHRANRTINRADFNRDTDEGFVAKQAAMVRFNALEVAE